jgi:hypothetical protein
MDHQTGMSKEVGLVTPTATMSPTFRVRLIAWSTKRAVLLVEQVSKEYPFTTIVKDMMTVAFVLHTKCVKV